jgi:FKBP-type peptidyl-prolyl cis-trans isomerase
MKEGGRYQLFVPPALGYGNQYPQYNNVIVFEVELDEIL